MYTVISTTGDRTSDHRLQSRYSVQIARKRRQINVMVIARPINLNVSCKLHLYSLQTTRSPPGPRLENTHPRNYYNLTIVNFLSGVQQVWIQSFSFS